MSSENDPFQATLAEGAKALREPFPELDKDAAAVVAAGTSLALAGAGAAGAGLTPACALAALGEALERYVSAVLAGTAWPFEKAPYVEAEEAPSELEPVGYAREIARRIKKNAETYAARYELGPEAAMVLSTGDMLLGANAKRYAILLPLLERALDAFVNSRLDVDPAFHRAGPSDGACECGWRRPLIAVSRTDGTLPPPEIVPAYFCPCCGAAYVPREVPDVVGAGILRELARRAAAKGGES